MNNFDKTQCDSGSLSEESRIFEQVPHAQFNGKPDLDTSLLNVAQAEYDVNGNESMIVRNYPAEENRDVVSVFDVASYVMSLVKRCTTMKLQKLLYYCQAWYLVWNEKPLFKEQIEAWANGPVIRELYNFHKGLFIITEDMMNNGNPNKLSLEQKTDIDNIVRAYASHSSQWLIEQTHSEKPWLDARKGLSPNERGHIVISHVAMAEYYSSLYGQE